MRICCPAGYLLEIADMRAIGFTGCAEARSARALYIE